MGLVELVRSSVQTIQKPVQGQSQTFWTAMRKKLLYKIQEESSISNSLENLVVDNTILTPEKLES